MRDASHLTDDWISAADTHNWVMNDPLTDYLDRFGKQRGFKLDHEMADYDQRFDYVSFIHKQSWAFREKVVEWLSTRFAVQTVASAAVQARQREKYDETLAAMRQGVPVIARAVLWNEPDRIEGIADLLIRSDTLLELCPSLTSPSPLWSGSARAYVVVTTKFTTLQLLEDGTLSRAQLPYSVQNWIYNEGLGQMQGYTPPASFLIGRDLFDRIARVPRDDPQLPRLASEAAAWRRRLASEGQTWQVLPSPSVAELRPNLKVGEELRWHAAKQAIAVEQRDLTMLPYVGPSERARALTQGITRWDDPKVSARLLGLRGEYRRRVDAVLEANRSTGAEALFPPTISSNVGDWVTPRPGDVYVSLQAVNDSADDFAALPQRGGVAMVFLIAWGWQDMDGSWQSRQLVARNLMAQAEADLLSEWRRQLSALAQRLQVSVEELRLMHWGSGPLPCGDLKWFDLLENVIYKEPVAVRGAFDFKLTDVAEALKEARLIQVAPSALPCLPSHALSVMAGAWSAQAEATERGCRLAETDAMSQISQFASSSCGSMMEIVALLRSRASSTFLKAA